MMDLMRRVFVVLFKPCSFQLTVLKNARKQEIGQSFPTRKWFRRNSTFFSDEKIELKKLHASHATDVAGIADKSACKSERNRAAGFSNLT